MVGFIDTAVGAVPQVATRPSGRDRWGTIGARIGFIRRNYRVVPGLYAVGQPSKQSPVLVTANYKLSFCKTARGLEPICTRFGTAFNGQINQIQFPIISSIRTCDRGLS